MSDNKFDRQIRTAALCIFFLGFVGGALALNAYHVWFDSSPPQGAKSERFERIFDRLELSDRQKADVQKIVGETREEIQALKNRNFSSNYKKALSKCSRLFCNLRNVFVGARASCPLLNAPSVCKGLDKNQH